MVDWDKFHEEQKSRLDVFWKHHQLIPDNQNQYYFAALWCNTPVWDSGEEEIKLFNKCIDNANTRMQGIKDM